MRIKARKHAVASCLLGGVAFSALCINSAAVMFANREIAAQIAALPGASAGSIASDLWNGKIVLGNVSVKGEGFSVQAGSITLPARTGGFAIVAPAMALDGAASADNLVIVVGPLTYKIAHLEASGTSMSAADLAALTDPKHAMPVSERLATLNAAAIAIPEILGTVQIGKIAETIAYKDVRLVNIVKGKIGAASLAMTELALKDPGGPAISVKMPNTEMKNIDLVQIARVMTQARTDPNEPLQTLYDSFSADGIVLTGVPDASITIGKISGGAIKARAMATPYLDLMGKITALSDSQPPSPEQLQPMAAAYADMFRSIETGSVEMRDLAVSAIDQDKKFDFRLGRMGMEGFVGGRLAGIAYENAEFTAKDGKVSLGNFSLRGLDLRPVLGMADAIAAQGVGVLDDPAAIRGFVPTLDHIGFSNISFDVPAENGQVGNADNGQRIKFQIGGLGYDGSGFIGGIPTSAIVSADHFVMDMSSMLSQPDMKDFAALGYKGVDLSSKLDIGWNEAAQELSLKTLSLQNPGMGTLKLSLTLGNVTRDLFSPDQSLAIAAVIGALAKKADISFANDGLVDKAIASQALKTKKSPDETRKQLVAGISMMAPAMLGESPAAQEIGNALAKFLANSKNLHITAVSADGLGVADLGLLSQPAELLGQLQVKAAVNE